jgi:hypothetical protein
LGVYKERNPWLPKDPALTKLLRRVKYYEELIRLEDHHIHNLITNYFNGLDKQAKDLRNRESQKAAEKKSNGLAHIFGGKDVASALV